MANISKMKLPNNTTYNLKDANAGYSVEIDSNNNILNLKNADGTVISSANLPAGGANFIAVNDVISNIGNIIRTSDNKLVAVNPKVVNIVDGANQTKVIAKIIYYAIWDGQYTPYIDRIYANGTNTTIGADELKVIHVGTLQSATIYNYISNSYVDYNDSHYYGVEFEPHVLSEPIEFRTAWEAIKSGSIVAKGFNQSNIAYGAIMQNTTSASITLDSNTTIRGTHSVKSIKTGLQDIKFYPAGTRVAMCNNVRINWQSNYQMGVIQGFTNGTGIFISKVKTNGTIVPAYRVNLNGGSGIFQSANCASDETNVVKVHVHTNGTFNVSAGDIELFIAFPTGKTIATNIS